ncbi:MAG: hypothetical protein KBG28_09360 [Kofleriaceae bacterium]|nr:hypothetical protein [Kofleriaceae bacterium]
MGEPSKPTRAWLVGAVVTIAAIFIFGLVGSELDARAKEDADGWSLDLWGFLFVYGGILGGIVGSLWGMVAGLLGRQTRWVRRTTLLGLGLAPLAAIALWGAAGPSLLFPASLIVVAGLALEAWTRSPRNPDSLVSGAT